MHKSRNVFLMPNAPLCIVCSYNPVDEFKKTPTNQYHDRNLREFKSFDESLEKGDYVVIPTGSRHGMTVVQVHEVGAEADIDSDTEVPWIIGKVDKSNYEEMQATEDRINKVFRAAEIRRRQAEKTKDLMDDPEFAEMMKLEAPKKDTTEAREGLKNVGTCP